MRFRTAVGPVQNNVCCWHYFYCMCINIYRVLTRIKRFIPYAFLTLLYNVTMLKAISAGVFTLRPNEGVHYPNITNRNIDHIYLLHDHKPRVEVISTSQDHIFLQTFHAACIDKCDRILVVFMPYYGYSGYFAFIQRFTVERGNDTYFIFLYLRDRHHLDIKQKGVDTITTRRKECCLRTFLTTIIQDRKSVV